MWYGRAHGKLNLTLSVGAPLPPGLPPPNDERAGWHPISSWMHAIALHDGVRVTRVREGEPSVYDVRWAGEQASNFEQDPGTPVAWAAETDLTAKAHRVMERWAGRELPVRIEVRKRIPDGGGLGGGSSDAASALVGVALVHGLRPERRDWNGMAWRVGSDVGFFLDHRPRGPLTNLEEAGAIAPRSALVSGFGDRVRRVPGRAGVGVVLVLPGVGCATPTVYKTFDRVGPGEGRGEDWASREAHAGEVAALARASSRGDLGWSGQLRNDLERAARKVEARVGEVLDRLRSRLGTPVHMTGSGSTLFALTPPGGEGELAACASGALEGMAGVRVMATTLASS